MRGKPGKAPMYPWQAIADEFIHGNMDGDGRVKYPTLADICKKYGPSYNQARRVLNDEDWLIKRKIEQANQQKIIRHKAIDDFEATASHFDATCMAASQSGIDHILAHFTQADAAQEVVNGVELDRLGRSFISYQRAGRLVLGLTTENTSSKASIEHKTESSDIDWSKLNDKELQILEMLAQRVEDRSSLAAQTEDTQKKPIPLRKKSS